MTEASEWVHFSYANAYPCGEVYWSPEVWRKHLEDSSKSTGRTPEAYERYVMGIRVETREGLQPAMTVRDHFVLHGMKPAYAANEPLVTREAQRARRVAEDIGLVTSALKKAATLPELVLSNGVQVTRAELILALEQMAGQAPAQEVMHRSPRYTDWSDDMLEEMRRSYLELAAKTQQDLAWFEQSEEVRALNLDWIADLNREARRIEGVLQEVDREQARRRGEGIRIAS